MPDTYRMIIALYNAQSFLSICISSPFTILCIFVVLILPSIYSNSSSSLNYLPLTHVPSVYLLSVKFFKPAFFIMYGKKYQTPLCKSSVSFILFKASSFLAVYWWYLQHSSVEPDFALELSPSCSPAFIPMQNISYLYSSSAHVLSN